MSLVAAGLAGVAAWLWVTPPTRLAGARLTGTGVLAMAAVAVGSCLFLLAGPRIWALATIAGLTALAGALLWRQQRRRTVATSARTDLLAGCELLAAELRAGSAPGTALRRAAADWPPLRPVAEAGRLGSDVPSALREAAVAPGCGDLTLLAAAWQVAEGAGGGLAESVTRIAGSLRAGAATRRVVSAELASARATARLMAGLPVVALAMGSGMGGDPVRFLFGTPAGWACLAAGLMLGAAGLWWIDCLADAVDRNA